MAGTRRWHDAPADLALGIDQVRIDYQGAVAADDLSQRVVRAGAGLDEVTKVVPAADLMDRIVRDAAALD